VVVALLAGLAAPAQALDATVQAPMTTVVAYVAKPMHQAVTIVATIDVPADAPLGLGVGAFVSDQHGHWFQECRPGALTSGAQEVRFRISPQSQLVAEPTGATWNAGATPLLTRVGLFFWSAAVNHARLRIDAFKVIPEDEPLVRTRAADCLTELRGDGVDAQGLFHATTGQRWTLSVTPGPFPENPYDPADFALDARITGPDGSGLTIAGFYDQPMALVDRGDSEQALPHGSGHFEVRFRPRQGGRYHIELRGCWHQDPQRTVVVQLPDLVVAGAAWDGYVHVDAGDSRFFSLDHQFYWPITLNLHATTDQRSHERMQTVLTPNRGAATYIALLDRCSQAGITAVEIWMASWNLGLEWRKEWPGFEGIGRYNQANAARLDAILDAAWARGIRINLVIYNHGQASPSLDSEWQDSPFNTANGGPLATPLEIFDSPEAERAQADLRRYIIARYADQPAILGWKLWSEINLTAAGRMGGRFGASQSDVSDEERHAVLVHWHKDAAAHWRAEDVYGHGVTTHWASDYRQADSDIMSLPDIGYVCIDAYLQRRGATTLAQLIFNSVNDMVNGLGKVTKPILVTEYGGSPQGATVPALTAEMAIAPWASLVSGLGGAPMLWWSEWVDQGNRWASFAPVARYLVGEDLRGVQAHAFVLAAGSSATGTLWAAAWERPGRTLGYVVDTDWAADGISNELQTDTWIQIGQQVPHGTCLLQWWNADTGVIIDTQTIAHAGGPFLIHAPPFVHHIAFKLWRSSTADPQWWATLHHATSP